VTVVRLSNGGVERLVVEVKQAATMQRSGRDRPCVSALDEASKEVMRLLAVCDPGEGAVLPLNEDAAVDQHLDQEARLTLRKAKGADGFGALCRQLIDVSVLGWER